MPDDFRTKFEREVARLENLRGEPLLRGIARLVDLADAEGDGDLAADWRQSLMEVAMNEGRLDYELAAFGGLRRQYETDARFADLRPKILWYFKWVGERMPEHVELSKDAIEATLAEMEAFYRRENEPLRPVHALRCVTAAAMGDQAAADRYFALWDATEAGDSDDCPACETHNRVQYLLMSRRADDAVKAAAPVLAGVQACAEVPATTFSRLLVPMLVRGDADAAEAMHRSVVRQVRSSAGLLAHLGSHVTYLSLTGRARAARRLAAVMLGRGTASTNDYARFCAWRAAALWLAMLAREGVGAVALPARAGLPRTADGDAVDVPAAAAQCFEEARALAAAFDRRNGNTNFNDGMDSVEQMVRGMGRTPDEG